MPARWIDLLERFELLARQAKRELSSDDYELFSARATQSLISKRYQPNGERLRHPSPTPQPFPSRDPTGEVV